MQGNDIKFQSCAASLHAFAARDFSHWVGLPPSCSLEEVTNSFPLLNEGVGLARLGQTKRQFRMIVVKDYSHPVRIWLDSTQVLMLDVQYPEISPSLSTVSDKLGEPPAKLDYDWGTLRIAGGEWVYPERGLALFINPNNFLLLHLAVFSPATVQIYEAKLRLRFGKRPLPGKIQ